MTIGGVRPGEKIHETLVSEEEMVRAEESRWYYDIHPVGTFSMAAQRFFVNGKPPKLSDLPAQPHSSIAEESSLAPDLHGSHTNRVGAGVAGEISFPYAFPEPGLYRCWVQMKSQGRILTGVFDTTVNATN